MKRTIVTIALLLVTGLIPGSARADFHDICSPPSSAQAAVHLKRVGTTLVYEGSVACGGADSVGITSLRLLAVLPAGPQQAPPATCACASVATSGTAPVAPGIFKVDMSFTATVGAQTRESTRTATYYFTMSPAQPVKIA